VGYTDVALLLPKACERDIHELMNYAIFRLQKRTLRQASAMARHALREMPTPNADPSRLRENTIVGPRRASEVMELIRSRTEPLMRRKDAVRCVELFIGASNEAMTAMTPRQQDQYFGDALTWAASVFGGDRENIVFAALHRDETTPHLQVLLTPIVDGSLAANRVIGGPAGLSRLQDEFAQQVGSKHGLRRGEKGSRAKHTSVRQFYAAIEAAGADDALPKRVPVPPVPGPLSWGASTGAKAAHAKAIEAREQALQHNRARDKRLIELARLGLATHGRGRRRLAGRLSKVEHLEEINAHAVAVYREARALLETLSPSQQKEVMSRAMQRPGGRVEVGKLGAAADVAEDIALTSPRRPGRKPR